MLPAEILGVCRLCLVTEHVDTNIFDNDSKQLYYKISKCLPISISENDQLPKKVCQNCDDKVHMVYEFWNQALDAQKHLLSWLNGGARSPENNCNVNSNNYSYSRQTQDDDEDIKTSAIFVNENDDSDAENKSIMDGSEETKLNEIKREENGSALKQLLGINEPQLSEKLSNSCIAFVDVKPEKGKLRRRRASQRDRGASGKTKRRRHNSLDEEGKRTATKHAKQLDVVRCRHCDQIFETSNERQKHERSVHPKRDVLYECDKCDYRTHTKGCFTTHLKRHIKQYSLFCEKCNVGFYTNTELTTHEIKAHDLRPFQCAECNEMFTSKGSLSSHIKSHDPSSTYVCEICGKTYKKKNSYKRHQFRSHMGTAAKVKCEECEKVLSSKDHLRRHMLTHTDVRNWVCATCGKCFLSRTYLNEHSRIHLGIRPYKCDVCEKSFTQRGSLTIHKRSHTGERPYRCEYCHKGFVMGTLLRYHLRKCTEAKLHEQCGLKKSTSTDATNPMMSSQHSELNVGDDVKALSYEAAFANKIQNDGIYVRKIENDMVELAAVNVCGMPDGGRLGN